ARQALKATASAVTILPFGNHLFATTLDRTRPEAIGGALLLVGGFAAACWLGWRRDQPLSLALAAARAPGGPLGTVSFLRSSGPLYFYFAVWLAFVPLVLLLAIGIGLLTTHDGQPTWAGRARRVGWGRPVTAGCVAVAVVCAAISVSSNLGTPP